VPEGKICYIEIPCVNAEASAAFYSKIFGWKTRARGDGHLAFDDTTGAVSGTWVAGRPPSREPGVLVYIMVDHIESALPELTAAGGRVVTPFTSLGGGDAYATFADPAGNLFGLYQQPNK